jgi:hypothetical protein
MAGVLVTPSASRVFVMRRVRIVMMCVWRNAG